MNSLRIVFFGSFQDYSTIVLAALADKFDITAVVTTAPKSQGRHMELVPTKVAVYAHHHGLKLYELDNLDELPKDIARPDFLVVAGYGKLVPHVWLEFPRIMPINMHPSLLPQYRGAFPAEWAILRGEKHTGVTLITLSAAFDTGEILVQKNFPIESTDTKDSLYVNLYKAGGALLIDALPKIATGAIAPQPQPVGSYFYARRLTRDDGYITWDEFISAVYGNQTELDRKIRALSPWPGVWTKTAQGKRLKIISLQPTCMVQLEGKKPVSFEQFSSVYLKS